MKKFFSHSSALPLPSFVLCTSSFVLLVVISLISGRITVEAAPLYDQIKAEVEKDMRADRTEDEIATAVASFFVGEWRTTTEDVQMAVQGDIASLCGQSPANIDRREWRCPKPYEAMRRLVQDEARVRKLGRTLQAIATGQELPVSDIPGRPARFILDLQGVLNIWSAGTSNAAISDAPRVRTVSGDAATLDASFTSLGTALSALDRERLTAAVWRYQYGHRLVNEDRAATYPAPYIFNAQGPGTEGQYLSERWNSVEEALGAIWTALPRNPGDYNPALENADVAYYLFPASLTAHLPANVIVWARVDGDQAGGNPLGDVGLAFQVPTEPVMPSLLSPEGAMIEGGTYPPEPIVPASNPVENVDGRGLCSQPIASRGYLCRTIDGGLGESRCPELVTDPNAVILTACADTTDCVPDPYGPFVFSGRSDTVIISGQGYWTATGDFSWSGRGTRDGGESFEVSGTGTWDDTDGSTVFTGNGTTTDGTAVDVTINGTWDNDTITITSSAFDIGGTAYNGIDGELRIVPQSCRESVTGPDVCKNVTWSAAPGACAVNLSCGGGGCATGAAGEQGDGDPNVCSSETPEMPATYVLYHQAIHALQKCQKGADLIDAAATVETRTEMCCRAEGEAYRATFELMERDGVFKNADGTTKTSGGLPLNAETASEYMANKACGDTNGLQGCSVSTTYPAGFEADLLNAASTNNPRQVPYNCSDAIDEDQMDARLKELLTTMEKRTVACTPNWTSEYKNTIGNNMCFIGSCIEQSMELHTVSGGRSPMNTGDAAFPWLAPSTVTPLGRSVAAPPVLSISLPTYRPGLLAAELDSALCQQQGLPPQSPSVLCSIDVSRRLLLPLQTGAETTQNILSRVMEREEPRRLLNQMGLAYGGRIGGELYANYLFNASRTLAGVLTIATNLLTEMRSVSFPGQMCPIAP